MSTLPWRRVLLAAALACVSGLAEAQAGSLKHDPFARPARIQTVAPAETAPANAIKAPVPEATWKPELRAIMAAGPRSMVNVEGALLGIGEQINGYRLVEVHEESAVFVSHGKRVTLTLRGLEPLRNPPPGQADRGAAQRRDASSKQESK